MNLIEFDRWLAHNLPTEYLKDFYPRAMRRLTELGVLSGRTVRNTKHGFKMYVDRLDAIKWYVHYYGEFEPCISRAFTLLLSKGGTVVDIGGNVGYHAMLSSVAVGPQGRVLSFEPAASTYEQLLANLALNGITNVEAIRAAVLDHRGVADLYLAGDNELGSSSLLNRDGGGAKESVSLITFEDIAKMVDPSEIDIIKIDVEGSEDKVIKGMDNFINFLKQSCVIFLEAMADDLLLVEPFVSRGFHWTEVRNIYSTQFYRTGAGSRKKDGLVDIILCRERKILEMIDLSC